MLFPVNYSKKYVQKVKNIVSLLLLSHKNGMIEPAFATVQSSTCTTYKKMSTGFKMVVQTPKLGMGVPLHTKFLLTKYFKSSHYQRKSQ